MLMAQVISTSYLTDAKAGQIILNPASNSDDTADCS